jgi:hypothetical protein
VLFAAPAVGAELEFSMTTSSNKIGTEDTFRCEIVVSNAPEGAVVQFPAPADFEVMSKSESTQMSYSVGSGGMGQIKQVRKYTLIMRATKTGLLTIPAAGLQTATRTYKTESIRMEVVPGRLGPDSRAQQRSLPTNPFGLPPGFPFGDLDPFSGLDDEAFEDEGTIPKNDSDLFLRASIDRPEVFVGEQVTLSLYIYSRVDLMGVDSVVMPKLEGFLAQDISTPTNLSAETRTLGGIPYRAYLLRSKALFPLKPGTQTIESAESDITSGVFPFSQRKIHRKSNALTLKVKALPKDATNVGRWRLSTMANQTDVPLGEPIQVKVVLEGRGNLKAVTVPKLEAPAAMRVLEEPPVEKSVVTKTQVGGARTMNYVIIPQQTGQFTIPGLSLSYFDPETQRIETSSTDAIVVSVRASGPGSTTSSSNGAQSADSIALNVLPSGGLRSLRYAASFREPKQALWRHPGFIPLAVAPMVLSLVWLTAGALRSRIGRETDASKKEKQARAARKRLAAAEKLSAQGGTTEFYGEVDKALRSFLEARLSQNVTGLTRPQLDDAMKSANIADPVRQRVLGVFETCDLGRYAPGMGDSQARRRALDDAAHAMEVWP